MFNTNITEMEYIMNRQNEETQNLLRILIPDQMIGTPIPPRKSQGNITSGYKWLDATNVTVTPTLVRGVHYPDIGTWRI